MRIKCVWMVFVSWMRFDLGYYYCLFVVVFFHFLFVVCTRIIPLQKKLLVMRMSLQENRNLFNIQRNKDQAWKLLIPDEKWRLFSVRSQIPVANQFFFLLNSFDFDDSCYLNFLLNLIQFLFFHFCLFVNLPSLNHSTLHRTSSRNFINFPLLVFFCFVFVFLFFISLIKILKTLILLLIWCFSCWIWRGDCTVYDWRKVWMIHGFTSC